MATIAQAPIEQVMQARGLEVLGRCERLSAAGVQLLHEAALLENFTPEQTDTLGDAMLRVRADAGQVLIAEGDTGDWMLLLLKGTVDVTRRTPQGVASRLAVLRPGAAIGEMSMLDGEPRYATCAAIEPDAPIAMPRGRHGSIKAKAN